MQMSQKNACQALTIHWIGMRLRPVQHFITHIHCLKADRKKAGGPEHQSTDHFPVPLRCGLAFRCVKRTGFEMTYVSLKRDSTSGVVVSVTNRNLVPVKL